MQKVKSSWLRMQHWRNGKKIATGQYEVKKGCLYFRKESVFDISQTNATLDDIPKLFPNRWIEGDVSNYSTMLRAFEKIADSIGVKVIEPPVEIGVIKGVSYTKSKNMQHNETVDGAIENKKQSLA